LKTRLLDGSEAALRQDTAYPWEGTVTVTIETARIEPFELRLRMPHWAADATTLV